MDYCQYHPLSPATHYCSHCDIYSCDKCVNDEHGLGSAAKCFHCGRALQSLGASQTATPFWRRLNESFRYPTNNDALALIFGSAILSSAAVVIPLGFILLLLVSGVVLKYSFCCLQGTAEGKLEAPKINEAYQGGLILLLQLFFLFICVSITISLSYFYLGAVLTMLISTILISALPAMVITFALSDNIFTALNPSANYRLIQAIGLPYLLLLGFVMIMFSSIGIVSELLSYFPPVITAIGEGVVSNYYMIVTFHMMGYVIFQYQDKIGFDARDDEDKYEKRSKLDRERARIDIQLKEGNYNKVTELFIALIQQNTKDRILHADFFNYLCAIKDRVNLQKLANSYFDILSTHQLLEQLYSEFRRCRLICPNYLPDDPKVTHTLAERIFASGDFKTTTQLLNGLRKTHENYIKIIDVYELLTQALEQSPNMQMQAEQCKQMTAQLIADKKNPKQPTTKKRAPIPPRKRAPIPPKKRAPIPPKKTKPLLNNSFGQLNTDFQAPKPIGEDSLSVTNK